jgi:hypothetical protein
MKEAGRLPSVLEKGLQEGLRSRIDLGIGDPLALRGPLNLCLDLAAG